jgi:hypothetical protein
MRCYETTERKLRIAVKSYRTGCAIMAEILVLLGFQGFLQLPVGHAFGEEVGVKNCGTDQYEIVSVS